MHIVGEKLMDKIKTKVKNADWWEITYLIVYGAIFTYEFLNTTMFEIQWPPRFGYIFLATSALYTIAKFIWNNTYTKKEIIWSGVILVAFIIPAIVTDYSFLWWTGFLIVGAKDVEFDKILKVYLTIGITIMLAAFVASQMGWIENLIYFTPRDGQLIARESFGSVYPTDFAAHIFYFAVAGMYWSEDKISFGKIINFIVLALFVYDKCGARTSSLCMLGMAIALVLICFLKKRIKTNTIYNLLSMSMIMLAGIFLTLSYIYDSRSEWFVKLDGILSTRLSISNYAFTLYDYPLFGQNIVENGWGRGNVVSEYFFLDDSYIRIALLYGVVLLVIVLLLFLAVSRKAIKGKQIIVLCSICMIALHSFMEHHLLEIAYNPFILYLFAKTVEDINVPKR